MCVCVCVCGARKLAAALDIYGEKWWEDRKFWAEWKEMENEKM